MVDATYRLLTEPLNVKRLRLVIGNSLGGMETWIWGSRYPYIMNVLVPMASLPSEMSSRHWMLRRLIIDSIRNDPAWNDGNYTQQPKSSHFASVFYSFATNGGDHALLEAAPTSTQADKLLEARLAKRVTADANDTLYQWDSSRDFDPSAGFENIQAHLLAINSADDERNPPVNGVLEREIKRVQNGRICLIPASENAAGHGTTGQTKY